MRIRRPYGLDRRPRLSERPPWQIEYRDGTFSKAFQTRKKARDELRKLKHGKADAALEAARHKIGITSRAVGPERS
jgi:hypothetical protein